MNEELYNHLRNWLFQQLETITIRMEQSKDEKGINMHSFYHGAVNMIQDTLHTLYTFKAKQKESEDK